MKIANHKLTGVEYIQTPNRSSKDITPRFIVIHYTASSYKGAIRTLTTKGTSASAHLVVSREGEVTQLGGFNQKLWHAGKSKWKGIVGLNSHSIGIEIENWGWLKNGRSWTGAPVEPDQIMTARHKNRSAVQQWQTYTEAQFDVVADICRLLCAEYGIDAKDIIGHDDISPDRKTDPGPAWDMPRFRGLVEGRASDDEPDTDHYKVTASSGLNMRRDPSLHGELIETLGKGVAVELVQREGPWALVARVGSGTTGWVYAKWLTRV